ncbi:hypothetical protein, partial [Hafnia alvei]|uniref:hypothetical protein n=1 Tax=Hafnia alvei TaxID=569 RepID=UPI001CAA8605
LTYVSSSGLMSLIPETHPTGLRKRCSNWFQTNLSLSCRLAVTPTNSGIFKYLQTKTSHIKIGVIGEDSLWAARAELPERT